MYYFAEISADFKLAVTLSSRLKAILRLAFCKREHERNRFKIKTSCHRDCARRAENKVIFFFQHEKWPFQLKIKMVNSGPRAFLVEAGAGIAPVFAQWDSAFPGSGGSCTWSLVLAKCRCGDRILPSFRPLSCFLGRPRRRLP